MIKLKNKKGGQNPNSDRLPIACRAYPNDSHTELIIDDTKFTVSDDQWPRGISWKMYHATSGYTSEPCHIRIHD